ncbi:MAG: hypothetical protein I8H87_08525 [Comamonadaceae bacterium]|jgi:hypothetical protein|nr:hypothetical protein [Comamonadaceae bacterium]
MLIYPNYSRLLRAGVAVAIAFSLASCGGSDDPAPVAVSRYVSDPPPRVAPVIQEADIPLAPLASLNKVTLKAAAAKNGLDPISTADPVSALGGRSVTNPFKPGNQSALKLVAGLEGMALPTGKWYKGFFYQTPLDLAGDFSAGRGIELHSVYAFPNRLYLDDRIGMVTIGFPHRFYLNPGDDPAKLGDFRNRYVQDDYLYSIQADTRPDVFVTHVAPASGRLSRRIDHQDELSVSTSWNDAATPEASSQSMQLIAANGAPYVTVKFKHLRPIVGIGQSIDAQKQKDALNQIIPGSGDPSKWEVAADIKAVAVDNAAPMAFQETGNDRKTPELTGRKFRFVYATPDRSLGKTEPLTQRVMVVYASDKLTLAWDAARRAYTATAPFTGVLRVAFVDEQPEAGAPAATAVSYATRESVLDRHANQYPVAGGVNLQYDGAANATVRYSWRTEALDGTATTGSQLLMMAFDATHLKAMSGATTAALTYRTNFGGMTGVVGSSWTQTLGIPDILRHSSDPKQKELWMGSGRIQAADKPALLASLAKDAALAKQYIPHCNYESYLCGKYVGNIARLALIADQLGEIGARDQMLDFLRQTLNPWFDGNDPSDPAYQDKIRIGHRDFFQYDTANGGVVTQRPFARNDFTEDFYNALYVDHMFHYGYYIYAAAVMGRYDPAWLATYKEPVNTLVRDIANASTLDKSFPITRTYDWFRMQNVADAGPTDKGGNTESSSEAINSGYALVLWGAATGNGELQALAAIMAAGEIRTAQAFYQVTPANNVFADVAPVTVPVIGGDGGRSSSLTLDPAGMVALGIKYQSVSQHQVFFGAQRQFRVGIQLLPITPISEYVISPAWAAANRAALLALEQDQTALYEDIFKIAPQDALCSRDAALVVNLQNPGGVCAGHARTLYSWRQIIASANGVNDPQGTFTRYLGYVNQVDAQTAAFARLSAGTPFQRPGDPAKGEPPVVTDKFGPDGIAVDILKDISTPSNNTNVLWWLSTRKL